MRKLGVFGFNKSRHTKLAGVRSVEERVASEQTVESEQAVDDGLLPPDTFSQENRPKGVMLCENELPELSAAEFVGVARRMGFKRPYRPGDILKVIERQRRATGKALDGKLIGVYSKRSVSRMTPLYPEQLAGLYGLGPVAVVESWNGNIGSLLSDGKQLQDQADKKRLKYPSLALQWAKAVGLNNIISGKAKQLEAFLVGLPEHPSRQKEFLMKLGYVSRISYLPTHEIETWMAAFAKIDIVDSKRTEPAKPKPKKDARDTKLAPATQPKPRTDVYDADVADIVAQLRPHGSERQERLEQRYREASGIPQPAPKPQRAVAVAPRPVPANDPVSIGAVEPLRVPMPERMSKPKPLRESATSEALGHPHDSVAIMGVLRANVENEKNLAQRASEWESRLPPPAPKLESPTPAPVAERSKAVAVHSDQPVQLLAMNDVDVAFDPLTPMASDFIVDAWSVEPQPSMSSAVLVGEEGELATGIKAPVKTVIDEATFQALFPHTTTDDSRHADRALYMEMSQAQEEQRAIDDEEKRKWRIKLKEQRRQAQQRAEQAKQNRQAQQREAQQKNEAKELKNRALPYQPKPVIPRMRFEKGTRYRVSKYTVFWSEPVKDSAGKVTDYKARSRVFSFGTERARYPTQEAAEKAAVECLEKCMQNMA